jgi:hypothetical protein
MQLLCHAVRPSPSCGLPVCQEERVDREDFRPDGCQRKPAVRPRADDLREECVGRVRHGEHILKDRAIHKVIAVVAVVWRSQFPWAYVGIYLDEDTTKYPNVALDRRIGAMVSYQRL